MNLQIVAWLLIACSFVVSANGQELPEIKVSDNGRFLVTEEGTPFFWLGDTAWELFHRLDRDEAVHYLQTRADQGFTVIQAVALAELDGLDTPNAYGHLPLIDHDPTKLKIQPGAENDYWDHVDFVIREANKRGLYVALLPTWGDKWNKKWGVGPEIFSPENAAAYGRILSERYASAGIVWVLGGDRPIESDLHREINEAMALGLRAGDGGRHLITWHPTGGSGSSQYFHDADWLDFNMRQNGHVCEFNGRYDAIADDYVRQPEKPVLDGEPIYEDHPISFDANRFGHSIAMDVRRPLYWDLFQGACGHTYGNHAVWQMWQPGREPINNPLQPWKDALLQPGAQQMRHARNLLLSRPLLTRVPAPEIIVPHAVSTNIPGAGRYRFVATRDSEGSYALVYAPTTRPFSVRMSCIRNSQVKAWWFNPRTGEASAIGTFSNADVQEFSPPERNEGQDWVLVLDDASQGFGVPGSK